MHTEREKKNKNVKPKFKINLYEKKVAAKFKTTKEAKA